MNRPGGTSTGQERLHTYGVQHVRRTLPLVKYSVHLADQEAGMRVDRSIDVMLKDSGIPFAGRHLVLPASLLIPRHVLDVSSSTNQTSMITEVRLERVRPFPLLMSV